MSEQDSGKSAVEIATALHLEKRVRQALLVEDNSDDAYLAIQDLQTCGCRVTHVETGKEALEAAGSIPFDLCVMDLALPGMDGVECARALARLQPALLIVVLTGSADGPQVKAALEAGWLVAVKPLTKENLRVLVRWLKAAAG